MAGDYEQFLDKIQAKFSPSQMTYQNILGELGKPTSGRRAIAQQFAQVSVVAEEISKTEDYEALKSIRSEIVGLPTEKHIKILERNVQTKLDKIGAELAKISAQRKEARLKQERIDKARARLERDRERYQTITEQTEDRRKRKNASMNLDKIAERMEQLAEEEVET